MTDRRETDDRLRPASGNRPHVEKGESDAGVEKERMWPLDVAIIFLSGLILYLVFTKLRFDDPRLLYSGRVYAAVIPVIALSIALVLRGVASQYVQKSAQLGFLFSVTVHLLLLIVAFQLVIFQRYYPETSRTRTAERVPVRRTVPESVFRTPSPQQTPDWSRPVEASTESRAIELAASLRSLPRDTAPQVELQLPEPREATATETLSLPSRRAAAEAETPQPAELPARSVRRPLAPPERPELDRPTAPDVSGASDPVPEPAVAERVVEAEPRRRTQPAIASLGRPEPLEPSTTEEVPLPVAPLDRVARREPPPAPAVRQRTRGEPRRRTPSPRTPSAVGSSPEPPAVAVATPAPDAAWTLAPTDIPLVRRPSETAMLPLTTDPAPTTDRDVEQPAPTDLARRSERPSDASVPAIEDAAISGRRSRRSAPRPEFAPAGLPRRTDLPQPPAAGVDRSEPVVAATDRLAGASIGRQAAAGRGPSELPASPADLAPAQLAEVAAAPLARATAEAGEAENQPRIAAIDRGPRRRRAGAVKKLAKPAGTTIVAAEPFNRRMMRTEAGSVPTPDGTVGADTEEAIERGLAYLAERQNEDGSWSLQGHGELVLLRSDTAATGLCLLAFQGAGYTHRQHQYAGTVARGLQFLMENQRTNGDLYVREDEVSNRSVAMYSHGIAALAMCEAYGMTQDPELREPAQLAINYIAATQHRQLGGWRYTPQISADTSVSGWMMMALKSGELAGLRVAPRTYRGIEHWLEQAKAGPGRDDRYRYNPFAPDTPTQRHGRIPTPTMTAVGMLMRMYTGWQRENEAMQSAADYLLEYPPENGTAESPQRDTYYWYYATQVMFHMGGEHWQRWNRNLKPVLLETQIKRGENAGSWDPAIPVPDRWSPHAGRLYVTAMNLLNLEVYYRHLPIYDETAE